MFIIKLIRLLRGTVHFFIYGSFPERFLNLCSRAGIPVWDIRARERGAYEAATYASAYKRLRPHARASGARLKVSRREGWPFLKGRYRRRWGLLLGVAIALGLLFYMSGCIWKIEVQGCETIDPARITQSLAELGLKPGVRSKSIDAKRLENEMMLREEKLSWIAVNIIGSRAVVEVKERVPAPEQIDYNNRACNIVAAQSGQIKYMEVYEGQSVLKVGDTVLAGEVIVSGVTEDSYGNTRLQYARAKVVAQVYEDLEVAVPLEETELVEVGEATVLHRLRVLGMSIPLSLPKKMTQTYTESTQEQELLGQQWIGLVTVTRQPAVYETKTYTELEAKQEAEKRLQALEEERFGGASVVDRTLEGSCDGAQFTLKARYTLEKDIAKPVEILLS